MTRLDSGFDVLCTGVGKSNAAGATARFFDPDAHRGVLCVGIAGALPGSGLELCDAVVASRSVFADEGIGTDDGLISMADAGFGAFADGSMGHDHDPQLLARIAPLVDRTGVVACVSWCSGTDHCATAVARRTGAIAEAMEGAAVSLAATRVMPAVATAEIRVISNTTGARANQRWALDDALDRLGDVFGRIASALG